MARAPSVEVVDGFRVVDYTGAIGDATPIEDLFRIFSSAAPKRLWGLCRPHVIGIIRVMSSDDSPPLAPALRAQLRLRMRRWLGLLAPDAPRRSPLRSETLLLAAAALDGLPAEGRGLRKALTGALFVSLHRAAGLRGDPFAEAARRWAEGAPGPLDADVLDAWDALLTAVELRPSTIEPGDVPRLLARIREAQGDHFARTRWSQAAREVVEARGWGPWLARRGVDSVDLAVGHLWAVLEPALIEVAPPAERQDRVRQAMENLVDWDARVARIAAEVSRVRGADAGQGTAARLLEPRIMSAWLTLSPDELLKLGMTCGRNLALATLTGPDTARDRWGSVTQPDRRPDPEAALGGRERWRGFFAGLTAAIEGGRLDARDAVFLWLSAGVGAGEAWRATGGAPARVGSANYARNKVFEALRSAVGGTPQRLGNPGAPDPRTRSLLGQLAMREAPDPSVEAEAHIPADARTETPPLSDAELLALMYVVNLGPEGAELLPQSWARPDPAALMTRALRHGAWARARRAVVAERLRAAGEAAGWPETADLLLLLGAPTAGSTVDAAEWLAERAGGDGRVAERWLAAPGPAHEAIERLRGLDRRALTPPGEPLPGRPVEREAKLRLHLRALTGGEP